jgi:sulfur carrier protein ThiS
VAQLSGTLEQSKIHELVLEESKTVAQLLAELGLSTEHVVLVNGERQALDAVLQEHDSVIVLPLIAGG